VKLKKLQIVIIMNDDAEDGVLSSGMARRKFLELDSGWGWHFLWRGGEGAAGAGGGEDFREGVVDAGNHEVQLRAGGVDVRGIQGGDEAEEESQALAKGGLGGNF
jgi:hypothetical protein